ncbi:HesA/MoeB/ThiF family protein [Acidimangrovimonas pyrenivorans]|uniref:HesA/MoeB/ThiF family protein n=1 Tax=Acidimangrovimonas pyrenivorans TaxID=2030798 RepID=A0ABV7AM45_9RHOB
MGLVLALAAGLWALGWLFKAPVWARVGMVGLLLAGVILAQLGLPDGHPFRAATGGNAQNWVLLIGAAALVLGYRALLGRLRMRAAARVIPTQAKERTMADRPAGTFGSEELERYARHIMLREIGGPGQKALKNARVLVIGAGGLGSPALLYLAAAGVGTIGVVDDDVVDNSNLQRQVIHAHERIGTPKVASAEQAMRALNPHIEVEAHQLRLEAANAEALFAGYDLVLDGSDNFDTRYLTNRTAAKLGIPLIAAAITQWEGQISLYDPAHGTPCYECIFPARPAPGLVPSCAEAGVVAPLPGVIGAMMALEAVKHITGAGQTLKGEMLVYDGLWSETRKFTLEKRADCPVCGGMGQG